MKTVVDLKTEVIHRYVFELRYDFGQIYWDRAGRIAKTILAEQEEWDFNAIDPNRCQLVRRDANMAFSFGPEKLDLSQTQSAEVENLEPLHEFSSIAEKSAEVVAHNLEIDSFPRIGFRAWLLYPAADRDQSYEFVRNLSLFRIHPAVTDALGTPSEVSHRLVVERPRHMLRIAVAPFEQQVDLPPSVFRAARAKAKDLPRNQRQVRIDKHKAEKKIGHYPQFGVLLDFDAYIEDPAYPNDVSVSDFIADSFEDFQNTREVVLEAAST
jgi:hypothetical protein